MFAIVHHSVVGDVTADVWHACQFVRMSIVCFSGASHIAHQDSFSHLPWALY